MQPTLQGDPQSIRDRFLALRGERPGLRTRDLADELGVSEGEVVAARCGTGVVRLAPRWRELLHGLGAVGPVMALTRNDYAVHEKIGVYSDVRLSGEHHGLVLDPDIDLRLFFGHWAHAFAVTETTRGRELTSIQVFDVDGSAVHKVYVRDGTDRAAFAALVAGLTSEDQSPALSVTSLPPERAARPDDEVDVDLLRRRWSALRDTHEFFPMLRDLDLGRPQALRLVGHEFARPLDPGAFGRTLEGAAAMELPIMVFVGNPGVIQIHGGPIRTVRPVGEWMNVLDDGFNLHLRTTGIAETWLVRKPTDDGIVTSVELFDAEGRQIAWIFGQRKPGQPELEAWRDLAHGLLAAAA